MFDKERIENAIKEILFAIGEDPTREGLIETPSRVANMYKEIFSGINADCRDYVKLFSEEKISGNIITIKDIPFYSMCEHHMLPFFGVVHVAYVPSSDKIIGLSKIARIVDSFSRKLQVQERLNLQIADFIYENVPSSSVAVIIEAEHTCMTMRGIKSIGTKTLTSVFKGDFKKDLSYQEKLTEFMTRR